MGKYKIDEIKMLIFASEDTRIRILGACYRNKILKIRNRPLVDDEIKFISNSKRDDEFSKSVETLKNLGLLTTERIPIPGMSDHIAIDITPKGIEILNKLGITEKSIRNTSD